MKLKFFLILPAIFLLTLGIIFFEASSRASGKAEPARVIATYESELTEGGVSLVEVTMPEAGGFASGWFMDKEVLFFNMPEMTEPGIGNVGQDLNNSHETAANTAFALIGAGLSTTPGERELDISLYDYDGTFLHSRTYEISVNPGIFKTDKLTLPKRMVEPGKNVISRITRERELIKKTLSVTTRRRLWRGGFVLPVEGSTSLGKKQFGKVVTSAFGKRRILNGKAKSPHSGVDLRASLGRPILASNTGIVVLTAELYYTGNTVIIDHGGGLFTLYSHLSAVTAEAGDFVEKEDELGLAGSTGRATGPHLHWVASLNGARVDPLKLVELTQTMQTLALSGTQRPGLLEQAPPATATNSTHATTGQQDTKLHNKNPDASLIN